MVQKKQHSGENDPEKDVAGSEENTPETPATPPVKKMVKRASPEAAGKPTSGTPVKKMVRKPAADTEGVETPGEEGEAPAEGDAPEGKKPGKKAKPAKAKPAPKRSQGVWGIDIGQCCLKAIRLEEIDGVVQATAFDYIEHPKILSQPDADRDALIREALEKFLANNNHLKGDRVAISVPGQSALTRFVKLPPVQKDKIADIVKFEAKQQIPFNLDEVIWDYQKVGEGAEVENFAMDTEIGLFAMKRDAIHAALQHFKEVGVEVDYVQIAPLALCNYLTYDTIGKTPGQESPPSSGCVVALDVGADSTNLVITDGGKVIWQKVISTGGNHFTRALTKDLKLTFAKAEHTKRNAAKSKDLKAILAALKPVLNDFEGEVKRSLNYFQNSHRSAQLEYILGMGNAFRLPGLQKFLEEKLGMPVRRLQKFSRLTGDSVLNQPVFQENLSTFTTAYGLALQGLERARLVTNLLPPELRTERLIRAKKPWTVAAAALLLIGLAAMALRYGIDYGVYNDPGIKSAISSAKSTAGEASSVNSAFESARTTALGEEEGVKSVVAGQKEHTNWLEMINFISSVVPRPDGTNLVSPQAKQKYFVNVYRQGGMSGSKAYELWKERQSTLQMAALPKETPMGGGMFPGVGPAFPGPMGPGVGQPGVGTPTEEDLGPGIDDLIQFNIESMDSRYCSNLETYFKTLRNRQQQKGNYVPLSSYEAPPKNPFSTLPGESNEKGWVVELRGYTFHADGREFIINTLMENIARQGRPDLDKPGAQPTQPVDPAQPPGMEAPAEQVPVRGPVLNRVSHVVLLEIDSVSTSDTANLKFAGQTILDQLVRQNPAAAGGQGLGSGPGAGLANPMPGGPGMEMGSGMDDPAAAASTGPSRDAWRPLTGGGGIGGPGMEGGYPGGVGLPGPMGTGGFPGPGGVGPGGVTGGAIGTKSKHKRTEFIILFVWYEPTPSDNTNESSGAETPTP